MPDHLIHITVWNSIHFEEQGLPNIATDRNLKTSVSAENFSIEVENLFATCHFWGLNLQNL